MTTVLLLLPEPGVQRWHAALIDRLAGDGVRVCVEMRPGAAASTGLALVEQLEGLLYRRGRASVCDIAEARAWAYGSDAPADFVFDLTGAAVPAAGAIVPLYNGGVGEAARDNALLGSRAPRIQLVQTTDGAPAILAEGLPALERPWLLHAGREAVATRLALLVRDCVRRGGAVLSRAEAGRPALSRPPATFLAASLASRVSKRLNRLLTHDGHWRIGWRACTDGEGTMDRLGWPAASWIWLDDDRQRYFADPFLFVENGVTYLFCEEYPYATQKAVISVFTLDAQGRASAPRVVLERPYHLSYPLVFRHDGQIWMMPESSANGTLELYRAEAFPERWALDRTLLSGLAISDATFFESGGKFWLTATTNEGGSSWDCLSLFWGPGPLGPWTRCGDAPALIDASAARPAGEIQQRGGALWRPAQDCTGGYGSGLTLCRIDHVGEDGFAQTVGARLAPPPGAPVDGVHTLNRGGGFETIDAVGPRSRCGGER